MINVKNIKEKFFNNRKVTENYFFMTLSSVISSLIGILIYPYVISSLGKDSFGLYVFAFSIVCFFNLIVAFGFDLPAMKMIVENKNDMKKKNAIMSSVFTAKVLMLMFATLLFSILCFSVPVIRSHKILYWITYSQVSAEILLPKFFFHAVQKMKPITYIQLFFRVLTIPFILIFIKNETQIIEYAIIISSSVVLGGIVTTFILWKNEGIKLYFVSIKSLKPWFKDAFPFFLTSSMSVFKQESVTVVIGIFFQWSDVAIYDLANKIIILLRFITSSINSALFPKVIANPNKYLIQKILRYEILLGLAGVVFTIVFGYWMVLILGGKTMIAAYPQAIILSILILSTLLASAYINFIFVQKEKYILVTQNQLIALLAYLTFLAIGLLLCRNITVVVGALAFSGIAEIFYCKYVTAKYKLLGH